MRTPIVAFGLCLSLAVTAPAGLFGQTPPAPAPAAFCWRGQALPACRNFAIFEVEGSYDVASTMVVDVSLQPTTEYPHPAFGNALNWRLGAMRNVSADWALGGTVNLGFDAWGTLTGVQVRARRWLKPRLSAEFE
ncbi:MAG TPA: hypothetical protein VJ957_07685, partial [Longimicrobiales bacterium]|nr:hypothetical protein [Longimicrobiales bacterium]